MISKNTNAVSAIYVFSAPCVCLWLALEESEAVSILPKAFSDINVPPKNYFLLILAAARTKT